jgi:hypothetical protein
LTCCGGGCGRSPSDECIEFIFDEDEVISCEVIVVCVVDTGIMLSLTRPDVFEHALVAGTGFFEWVAAALAAFMALLDFLSSSRIDFSTFFSATLFTLGSTTSMILGSRAFGVFEVDLARLDVNGKHSHEIDPNNQV